MISFPILLCVLLGPVGQAKIHENMSAEEVMKILETTHEDVREYELVDVKHMRHKRSGDVILQTRSFGKDIQLYLEPTEGFLAGNHTKVYTAKSDNSAPNGIQYAIITNAMEGIGDYYQDLKNNAAVTVTQDKNGRPLMDGTLGNNLGIRPIPEKIHENGQFSKDNFDFPAIDNIYENNFDTTNHPHFVFKTPNDDQSQDTFVSSPDIPDSRVIYSRSKRDLPEVVYPEILVIVDEKIYSKFSKDVRKTVSYIISFWNGVDLRYRSIENPKVRLNIAGIILAENTLPYVTSACVKNTDQLDATNLLKNMGEYFYEENRIKYKTDFDVAIQMTGYDLASYDKENNEWASSTQGLADIGGACRANDYDKSIKGVGTIEDNGGFSGIIAAAHELAHLLGVPHDGEDSPEYVGGPGAKSCSPHEGHIMSYESKNEQRVRFSTCSQQSMTHYLNSKSAECLHNIPHVDEPLPRILPGKYMSLNEQCRMEAGTKACYDDERICVSLYCQVKETNTCTSFRPAAEGSPCGNGNICLNGECVSETVKTVPGL